MRDDQFEGSLAISNRADFQTPAANPQQQVLNLVQRLNRGGGIIYRRREGTDRNIHQQADSVFWILLKSSLAACHEGLLPSVFLDQSSPAPDLEQKCSLDQRVSDGRHYFDD